MSAYREIRRFSSRAGGRPRASTIRPQIGGPARGLLVAVLLAAAVASGCGGGHRPAPIIASPPGAASGAPPAKTEYLVHVGDEVHILVVGQPEFSTIIKVKPDGKISVPGAGEIAAAGRSLEAITEDARTELQRLIRYPDVSVMLTSFAREVVYVLGEVRIPGSHEFMPEMTVLHALGAASGPARGAKLNSVLVLRRSSPSALDVYQVDLDQAVDGNPLGQDMYLQPYDVVFVPKTFIAGVNDFVEQYIRQNVTPFSAYIEGWRALNLEDIYWRRPD